jgi:hypothetical protein
MSPAGDIGDGGATGAPAEPGADHRELDEPLQQP